MNFEQPYLHILERVMSEGEEKQDRTGTGTLSMFGLHTKFDISTRVPLLTSKFVPWKMVIKELLWFLHGETDAKKLQAQKIHIWDGNSSRAFLDERGLNEYEEGDIGPGYGFQWRHFGAHYKGCWGCHESYGEEGVDQISTLIEGLRKDPDSRRHFLTAWNPKDLSKMALPPCHLSAQFYVEAEKEGKRKLSCHLYQRSVDLFLGFPFNIFSYSALVYLLCEICDANYVPGELIVSMGDAHIYKNHIEQVKTLIKRQTFDSPILMIDPRVKGKKIDEITFEHFSVQNYQHSGALRGEMS